jgi:hypothetical protein
VAGAAARGSELLDPSLLTGVSAFHGSGGIVRITIGKEHADYFLTEIASAR